MWKDFFYFSRTEKQGVIVLIALIAVVILAGAGLSFYHKRQEAPAPPEHEEAYRQFNASLREQEAGKAQGRKEIRKTEIRPFDPNTADSATFCRMGLQPWIARNILRYRAKGGRFRTPEEFKKIYGLSEEQYATLLPYVYIGDEFRRKERLQIAHEQRRDTTRIARGQDNNPSTSPPRAFKYPAGTTVDLNTADTTEFKKIPGIGSVIARRIVNYRNRLGGFHHLSQLREIQLDPVAFANWFTIKDGDTQRINLNTTSVERLRAHPYLNFYQAKVIVEYRKKKGDLKRLSQLAFYDEFTDEELERIKPYVCFE